jgi:hypothetical protein
MCIAFIEYTVDSEHLSQSARLESPLDLIEIR